MKKSEFRGPNKRIWLLGLVSLLLFFGLGVRLAQLQVVRHNYYDSVADSQRRRASELTPHRGTIYVSEGRSAQENDVFPVATNKRSWIAYAVPRDMNNPEESADKLAPALFEFRQRQEQRVKGIIDNTGQAPREDQREDQGEEPELEEEESISQEDQVDILRQQLFAKFNRKTDPYEPLLRPYELLDGELKGWLDEQNLEGVVVEEIESRAYPEESLLAHTIGYVGYQGERRVGRYGIEGYWEDRLSGDLGFHSSEQDTFGQYIGIEQREFKPAQDGDDIVLTIDRVVQSFIEEELKRGVEHFAAERGSIVVMDPATGAILGMATYPTFDPNYYYAISDPRVQSNPVVSDQFEPGSILKPLIMAAAIEEGVVGPDTTMVDNGPVRVAEYTIDTFDGKHAGRQTMTQVLEQSNNIGMVWVGQQLGSEVMYDYLRRFGLGEQTGISLEGETRTHLPEPDKWNITTVATASFGQGIVVSPLQALNAVNAIANGGELVEPRIVNTIRRGDGEVESFTQPASVRRVISSQTAETLSAMLVSVIENGVAGLAQVPGYHLAGKTGTAQVADENGQYSKDKKIISFVGFGPVDDPKFSILVKLDNPAGLSFASGTAAPMFRNIAEKLLNYYQIPPTYEGQQPTFHVSSNP